MAHAWLRILLAMYLAMWSPAMCCCAFKHVIGRITGIETPGCHGTIAVTIDLANDAESQPRGGCCAAIDDDQSSAGVGESCSDGERASNEPDNHCRCHESIESKVRLDTGSKVVAPALAKHSHGLDLIPLPIASIVIAAPVAVIHTGWPPGGDQDWLSSGQTLLARRCLLLI